MSNEANKLDDANAAWAMAESEKEDAQRHARILAGALRDINNIAGEIEDIKEIYQRVSELVSSYPEIDL